ncbi:15461_t:CDS:1, partial [Racocetra persica]
TTQTLILDKHIEDIIPDKEPDQKEKEAAFVTTQDRVTPEVCDAITSVACDDGCIELNGTVCKELDLPKEEIISTVQKNVTNEKLKSPKSSSWLSIFLTLKMPHLNLEINVKINTTIRDYLSKQIGDANAKKELLNFTDNYVVDNCAKKKSLRAKRGLLLYTFKHQQLPINAKIDVVSKQKDDGSFEISDTICKELEVPTEEKELVTAVKLCTLNEKFQSP